MNTKNTANWKGPLTAGPKINRIWAAEHAEHADHAVLFAAEHADHAVLLAADHADYAETRWRFLRQGHRPCFATLATFAFHFGTHALLCWGFRRRESCVSLNAMQKTSHRLIHWELTERIIGIYHDAHYEFGDGFLEKLCQKVMIIALADAGLKVTEGMRFDVHFRGHRVGRFFADLVVNDLVLVEVKSCPALEPRHKAQVINYLRASSLEVGLLLNFGPKREFDRIVYSNERKKTQADTNPQPTVLE